jgi:hypothetical protein
MAVAFISESLSWSEIKDWTAGNVCDIIEAKKKRRM